MDKSITSRIKAIRLSMKYSQEEFGDFLKDNNKTISNQLVSNIENSRRNLNIDELTVLCNKGIDLNWLITGVSKVSDDSLNQLNSISIKYYQGLELVHEFAFSSSLSKIFNFIKDEVIYIVKIPTEMMSPTIKINDIVFCTRRKTISNNGIYIRIHPKSNLFFVGRFFKNLNNVYDIAFDNKHFPARTVAEEHLIKDSLNILTLKVFSINNLIDQL